MSSSGRLSSQIPECAGFAAEDFFQLLVKRDGLHAIKSSCKDLGADCAGLSIEVSLRWSTVCVAIWDQIILICSGMKWWCASTTLIVEHVT